MTGVALRFPRVKLVVVLLMFWLLVLKKVPTAGILLQRPHPRHHCRFPLYETLLYSISSPTQREFYNSPAPFVKKSNTYNGAYKQYSFFKSISTELGTRGTVLVELGGGVGSNCTAAVRTTVHVKHPTLAALPPLNFSLLYLGENERLART